MKKFFCVLLTITLLLASSAAFAASIPQPVLGARGSVVNIVVPLDEQTGAFGSGFAIGTTDSAEYIVTNHHVIEGNLGVILVAYGEYDSVTATVAVDLPEKDLCVLKLNSPIEHMPPIPLYDGDPYSLAGEQVYAIGFPGVADELFERNQSISDSVTVTNGIVSAVKNVNSGNLGINAVALQVNAGINHGNSGGPLVNDSGAAVGVSTYSANELNASDINGAISISELIPILDQRGISYKATSNPFYSGMFGLILVIAIAAALLLLWFFLFRKKLKHSKTVPLATYLEKSSGKFSYDQAIALLAPITAQLDAMHREGKTHLAVYPQNIRVRIFSGQAFLVPPRERSIQNGYSAPEQYREMSQVGPWTDIYQLGAILYKLLTGERLPDVMARLENDDTSKREIESLQVLSGIKQALRLAVAMKPDIRLENAGQFMTVFHISPNQAYRGPANFPIKKKQKVTAIKKKKRIIILCIAGGVVAAFCIGAGVFVNTTNQAYKYLADGDYARANQTISKLPSLTKDIASIKNISEAGILLESKQYEEARRLLEGLEAYPEAWELSGMIDLRQGLDLLASGQTEDGEAYIETFLEKDPDFDRDVIDYARGDSYFTAGNFIEAEKIFSKLGDFEDAQARAKTSALAVAEQLIEQENYKNALDHLKKYSDDPNVRDVIEDLQSLIYVQGLNYIDEKNYNAALKCFRMIPDYENSDSYIDVLGARNYHELEPYIDTVLGQEILYRSKYMLHDYLTGYWSNGNYYFRRREDGSTSYDIPWLDGDGNMYTIDENGNYIIGGTPCYQFIVIDADTMDVYAYANGNTYRMHRQ